MNELEMAWSTHDAQRNKKKSRNGDGARLFRQRVHGARRLEPALALMPDNYVILGGDGGMTWASLISAGFTFALAIGGSMLWMRRRRRH